MLRSVLGNTSKTKQSKPAGNIGKSASVFLRNTESRVAEIIASHTTILIRISLATVFIWFGLLKIIGHSPVTDIVAQTMQWSHAPTGPLMLLLGAVEMALGIGLLVGRGVVLRVTLWIFLLHLSGTLLVLAQADIAFQMGNPLLLTTEGEFVIKNLVMITAGLVLLGRTRGAEVDTAANWKK